MKLKNQFWNWIRDEETGERVLYLEGPIDQDAFWGDEITPQKFKEDLESGTGDIVVYITSPGGNVFAASDIYTMLLEYKGKVTVKISSIAASAASVIAMAGDTVMMSPTAQMMIHNPSTFAYGNAKAFEETIAVLNKIRESLINAYQLKTGLSRAKIVKLLDGPTGEGTWMPANEALDYGFIDRIISKDKPDHEDPEEPEEPEEPEGPEDPEEPDEGEQDDPEKLKLGKAVAQADKYSRMYGLIHRGYLALMAEAGAEGSEELEDSGKAEEPEEPEDSGEAKELQKPREPEEPEDSSEPMATYDVMLKQLEMIKDW